MQREVLKEDIIYLDKVNKIGIYSLKRIYKEVVNGKVHYVVSLSYTPLLENPKYYFKTYFTLKGAMKGYSHLYFTDIKNQKKETVNIYKGKDISK